MSSNEPIRWSFDPTDSRLALVCLHGAYGILGGVTLIVLLGIVFVAVTTVLSGRFEILALTPLLGLVGGPLSLLYLLPQFTDSRQRPGLVRLDQHLRPLPLAVASIISAGALIVTVLIAPWLLLLFPILYGTMFVITGTFDSTGELDPVRRIIRIDDSGLGPDRELAFDDYDGFRRFEFAGVTAFRLSSAAQRLNDTHWLTVPALVAPAVERVIEHGITHEPTTQPTEMNRTVQATLVVFGLLFVGTAIGIVVVGRSTVQDVVVMFMSASIVGMFGFLFFYLAYDY